ncbi:MAG: Maf family protein [Methylocystaceae bacterium]
MQIILASASPRRYQLLQQLGLDFLVVPADVNENITAASPWELAEELARQKARRVASLYPQAIVIAADTMVVIDGQILGKPGSQDEARSMLNRLSGREHQVITGVSVQCQTRGYNKTETETTRVVFRELQSREIEAYIDSRESFDKAGAYGIQGRGALLVTRIEGCYFNVVGLPLNRLGLMLRDLGIYLLGG